MEKEIKKRRRSVRNLRRTSGILPLNLDVLDEKPEESKNEDQCDENQQMFGSMWCESLEPVVKKRRRRSSLLIGLVPKRNDPDIEEENENYEIGNQKAYLTRIGEDQTLDNDTESILKTNKWTDDRVTSRESPASEHGDNYHANIEKQSEYQTLDNYKKFDTRTNDLSKDVDTFNDDVMNKHERTVSKDRKDERNKELALEMKNASAVKTLLGDQCNTVDDPCNDVQFENDRNEAERSSDRLSLNTSDSNSLTPCNLSNVSPSSMSPEYPGLYQDTFENIKTAISADNKPICNKRMLSDAENEDYLSDFHSKSIQKSPGMEHMSDTSHSDKENSVLNENISMNITPHVQGDSTENVSPGFMSMCKAFAGKVVNFVKTSPSFLTGGLLDSSNTANVCASPELKRNTSLNVVASELTNNAVKSDFNKSLKELGSETDNSYKGLKDSQIVASCKDDNSAEDIDKEIKTPDEKSLSTKKSQNQGRFGSGKKTRDRKLFFDTYNAVMDVLKNDKVRNTSTSDTNESKSVKTDETGFSCPSNTIGKSTQSSKEQINSNTGDENLDDRVDGGGQNVEINVTQHFSSPNQKSLRDYENFEPKIDSGQGLSAGRIGIDEPEQNTSEICGKSEDKDGLNDAGSENLIERKIEVDECQDKSSSLVAKYEGSCEKLDRYVSSTDDFCDINKTDVKGKNKRYKRRALDIPVSDNNVNVKSAENVHYLKTENSMELGEEKQILENCEAFIETVSEKNENAEELFPCVKDSKNVSKSDTQENIKNVHDISQLAEKQTAKSFVKAKRNRRQSFGIQSCRESTERNLDSVSNNVESDLKINKETISKTDEVDGMNDDNSVERNNDIEHRVAALNLGNEVIANTKGNIQDEYNVEKRDNDLNDHVEKKKRGRRRKSANLNEILKRGRPKKVIIEPDVDEAEEFSVSQKDGNESNNVSELTDEISQVQIIDSDKRECEITVESLVLPGDDVNSLEGIVEPRRKRRRSAEAASLRLQMINSDQSPSGSETVAEANKAKRGRRKSADSSKFETQADLNKENSFIVENSSPDNQEPAVTKRGKKRKFKEETAEELEKIYRNKNFVRPEEKKPWHTVLESPPNLSEVFGKKRLQRHIDFHVPTQMKLRRRLQKAVKNGWDPKKRMKMELEDDFVKGKLVKLWSELDEEDEDTESLQNKLRSIVETT